MVLALVGDPGLAADVELDLLQVNVEDLRSEMCDEVLREDAVVCLERTRQLGGIAEPKVETGETGAIDTQLQNGD